MMTQPRAIVGCECSGRVRSALRRRGIDAYSCDILPADDGDPHHIQEHIHTVLKDRSAKWDLLVGHPPCTYLALCQIWRKLKPGQEWRAEKEREALEFFRALWEDYLWIPRLALENPMSIASTHVAPRSQVIHPWMFGHPEQKTTWLWLRNLPPLQATNDVFDHMMTLPRKERERIHFMSPGKTRSSQRDKTYEGVAEAIADQWAPLLFTPAVTFPPVYLKDPIVERRKRWLASKLSSHVVPEVPAAA
jgi:hypothetical protein